MLQKLRSRMGTAWCSLAHDSLMWPVHGRYECRICGRHYPAFVETPAVKPAKHTVLKPALPLLLAAIFASLAHPAAAAEIRKGHDTPEVEAALERYIAGGEPSPWAIESIEIHGALPGLQKTGELRAIRRPAPIGQSRYEVVQFTGDRTVKDQVIVRYLHAEERAAEISRASVAITPANYKFSYKGSVDDGERQAYIFQITPRHKRDGLIQGELWLDRHTGVVIRRSGRLVKSPSMFIKRIAVTQENAVRDGIVESRLTRIAVDTRLVGRAELVIKECPLASADARLVAWDNLGDQQ